MFLLWPVARQPRATIMTSIGLMTTLVTSIAMAAPITTVTTGTILLVAIELPSDGDATIN